MTLSATKPSIDDCALTAEALTAANVNPETWLATDYLNHFNEIEMLLEMLPEMPDCLPEVLEWTPKSYVDHFTDSRFNGRETVITAYLAADPDIRRTLENIVAALDHEILIGQHRLKALAAGDAALAEIAASIAGRIRPLMQDARAVINGRQPGQISVGAASDDDIDALFA